MNRRWPLVVLASLAGVGLALHLRPTHWRSAQAADVGVTAARPTDGPLAAGSRDFSSARAPDRGLRIAPPPAATRRVYDLTRNDAADELPIDADRDAAWAGPMERALEQHGRAELMDLIPDATWLGVACQTRVCTVRYRTRPQPPEVMAVVQSFVLGPGTAHQHEERPGPGGTVEWVVTVAVRDEQTHERLSADDYLARQEALSPDRRELRDQVRDHFHNHPDDHH